MRKFNLASVFFFIPFFLYGNIGPSGFIHYPNPYFVETGTHHGAGISKAMEAGFKEIRSIDIDPDLVDKAVNYFSNFQNVKLFCGDSSKELWNMIKDINEKITFWLDGHNIYPVTNKKNCPLLEELEQIKWHPIKNHTIIIDDMHCLDTIYFDYISRNQLISKIHEINPAYQISYIVGGDQGSHPNNIMVARIP